MSHRIALVVDDDPILCKAVERMLRSSFSRVLSAHGPEEADQVLRENLVTHIVCDNHLGWGLPLGTDLVPKWRDDHKSIERAVLFTSNDLSTVPRKVDAVVLKP